MSCISCISDNKALCGPPTEIQCSLLKSPSPTTENSSSSPYKKLSTTLIASIAGVLIAIIGTAFAVLKHKKRNNGKQAGTASSFDKARRPELVKAERKAMTANEDRDHGRLVFVREESWERFELNDLLKASAEVLGSGEFGSSYKALLINGPAVVVKRFREMNRVGKEEFQGHMRSIGMLSHPNLLPLVAYYYRKEEKLLVTDFVPYGSLASLLHSNRTPNNPSLDWPTRLKIIKGVTRGLNYLYDELSILNAPHGHLKSSNVLLTSTFDPLLTDYALTPLMNQTRASQSMIAFKSPEYKQYGRLSRKSDVWSLGVLILEILTGRLPGNYSRQARGGSDLANWVNSVVREEWTGEVFDGSMRRTRHGEGEMLDLLQIGLGCCEADVNKRWELRDVIEKIVELKERDEGEYEDGGSSMASEGEGYSSRGGITEDDFSFSTNNP